MPPQSVRSRCY